MKTIDISKLEDMDEVKTYNNRYVYKSSPHKIKLPTRIDKDLSYLIGVIYGDGSVKTPIKRKKGGFYRQIEISCRKEFIKHILPLIEDIFDYRPTIYKDKRKNDCYHVMIQSSIIYHFFTDIIGMRKGRKSGNLYWIANFESDKVIFSNFVAGFMDTDGYMNKEYACIVQKDRIFLKKLRNKMAGILGLNFNGPYVNKRIDNVPICWWIITRDTRNVLRKIPLRYRARSSVWTEH